VTLTGVALGFDSRTYMRLHVVNSGRFAATVTEVGYQVRCRGRRWPAKWSTQYWESTNAEVELPLRLEGQADFAAKVPLTQSARLLELLNEHPEWYLVPWAMVGGRSVYGKPVIDDQMDIRHRLRGYLSGGDPSDYLPMN
jgi:hypothetical protein